jgi:hypothetical protein
MLSRYSRMSERVQHDEQCSSLHNRWHFRYDQQRSSPHAEGLSLCPIMISSERQCITSHHTIICIVYSVYGQQIISRGLWPPCSPDLNQCNFYLWGMLKDEVNGNDPHTSNELKKSIKNAMSSTLPTKLQQVC